MSEYEQGHAWGNRENPLNGNDWLGRISVMKEKDRLFIKE